MQAQLPGCEASCSGCMASGLEIRETVAHNHKRATLDNTWLPNSTISYLGWQSVVQRGSFAGTCSSLADFKFTGHTARETALTHPGSSAGIWMRFQSPRGMTPTSERLNQEVCRVQVH